MIKIIREKCVHYHCRRSISKLRHISTKVISPSAAAPPTASEIRKQGLPILYQAFKHASSDKDRILSLDWRQHQEEEEEPKGEESSRNSMTYSEALDRSSRISNVIQERIDNNNNETSGGMIASLCNPGWEYICTLWGIWGAGKASIPISLSSQVSEIEYLLEDTKPELILVGGGSPGNGNNSSPTLSPTNETLLLEAASNIGLHDRVVHLREILDISRPLSPPEDYKLGRDVDLDDPALILYTSGTTGKPKGVVSTHRNIFHQVTDLVSAWEWNQNDVAIHVLPLHHVHGVINILTCATYSGATIDFRKFNAVELWKDWAETTTNNKKYNGPSKPTVFMAVPTIYAKLLEAAESLPTSLVETAVKHTLQPMRLMVSGSAALPVSVLEKWKVLTGHTLLERYGMTEIGMALSNPYKPEKQRHAGHVGQTLNSVDVKIMRQDENGQMIHCKDNESGTLFVKGDTVFQKYLNRPDATQEAFDNEGYFDTGDVAIFNPDLKSYRILGRASVDILKVGGYKLSALEIERIILEHPSIAEVVIMGIPDDTWGERVAMMARLKSSSSSDDFTLESLRDWCQDKMSKYKVPSRLLIIDEIPKNAMGKVNKKDLIKMF